MPIANLPPQTVRAICSSQVLTDPVSVVKELVENALDAGASAIFIDISLNALDVIQVKDNGHGIAPEDRALVCRRYCTSKIRDLDDLSRIGGTSLGFRGEALASAAELSESVTVLTRIEGEAFATSIKFDRLGEIISQEPNSHPVGTTVRVIDYLRNLPVRRESALKSSVKTATKAKVLLQAYVFARPTVRLSLKVLKAKNDKMNWVYGPKVGATVLDAALKIVGKPAVDQCEWAEWPRPNANPECNSEDLGVDDLKRYRIEALVPKRDCDISIIGNLGQYISIDRRPVSYNRGTTKQIVNLFKKFLQSAKCLDSTKVINPFLCMKIFCPTGSYDANIEPAKDDVLFADSENLLLTIKTFLTEIYGGRQEILGESTNSLQERAGPRGFELLLRQKPFGAIGGRFGGEHTKKIIPESFIDSDSNAITSTYLGNKKSLPSKSPDDNDESEGTGRQPDSLNMLDDGADLDLQLKTSIWNSSIHNTVEIYDEPEVAFATQDAISDDDDASGSLNIATPNPWITAKSNAPVRRANLLHTHIQRNEQLLTPERSKINPTTDQDEFGQYPTPHRPRQPSFTYGPEFSPPSSVPRSSVRILGNRVQTSEPPLNGFTSAGNKLGVIQLREILGGGHQRKNASRKKQVDTPHVSPVNDLRKVWIDQESSARLSLPSNNQRSHSVAQSSTLPLHSQRGLEPSMTQFLTHGSRPSHPDLAFSLDFESRKQAATQLRQQQLHQQKLSFPVQTSQGSQPSHHQAPEPHYISRCQSAIAALNPSTPSQLHPADPRTYLLRAQREDAHPSPGAPARLRRRKTSSFPLETIPTEDMVRGSEILLLTSEASMECQGDLLRPWDAYIRSGDTARGLTDAEGVVGLWQQRVEAMLDGWVANGETDEGEGEGEGGGALDFAAALRRHVGWGAGAWAGVYSTP